MPSLSTTYRPHPLADLLPPMTASEFAELCADIDQHGQRERAVLYRDAQGEPLLLDGRHRARACAKLGIPLRTTDFEGTEDEARALVLSLNIHRRHLTPSQRSLVAGALAQRSVGRPAIAATLPEIVAPTTAAAAQAVGVSERTARDGALVVRSAPSEMVEAVAVGELSVSQAAGIVRAGHRDRQAAAALFLEHRRHSASDSWLTPGWLVERIEATLGGRIDGDPAAEPERGVPARWHYTADEDGLAQDSWANSDGTASHILLNPPYNQDGKGPGAWTRRAVAEWEAGRVERALLVLPFRPGAHWLRALSTFPRVELTGRVAFEPGYGNPARPQWEAGKRDKAQFASILIGVGMDAAELHAHFGDVGVVMVRYGR